ncbi:MAG TPA: hypothetical protein PKE00_09920, partial [Planctomycetota bacterium]|nr:hypothetical protein [Planctomycetota bacterium]
IDPWVDAMIRGTCQIAEAWQKRGTGFADTVGEAGWEGFTLAIEVAKKQFQRAWQIDPKCPESATDMIAVCMGNSDDRTELLYWFEQGLTAQFDYTKLHLALLWALYPRWGGSLDSMMTYGRACLATGAWESQVPDFYWNAFLSCASELEREGGARRMLRTPGVLEEIDSYLQGVHKAEWRKPGIDEHASHRVLAHFLAGKRERAVELYAELGDRFVPRAFDTWKQLERQATLDYLAAKLRERDDKGGKK